MNVAVNNYIRQNVAGLNMKIKHFLITRFFPFHLNGYAYDIESPDFLKSQASLFERNLFSSIKNQTNKDMTLIVIVNERAYKNEINAQIIDSLKSLSPLETVVLPCPDNGENSFTNNETYQNILKSNMSNCDYLIETRTDFDDFFYYDASQRVRNLVDKRPNGITMHGYCKGITFVSDTEMYEFDYFRDGAKRIGSWSVFLSMILNCNDCQKKPFTSIFNYNHGNFGQTLTEYGDRNDIQVNIVRDELEDAFVYFRHNATYSNKGTSEIKLPPYANVRRFTEEECKNYLENVLPTRFGFEVSDHHKITL